MRQFEGNQSGTKFEDAKKKKKALNQFVSLIRSQKHAVTCNYRSFIQIFSEMLVIIKI